MSGIASLYPHENYDPNPDLKVWFNGELVPAPEARVNIFDHGLLYGDGIFEGIRSYNGRIFERRAHLKRLFASAKAITLALPHSLDELDRAMDATLEANGFLREDRDAYIRIVATRGVGRSASTHAGRGNRRSASSPRRSPCIRRRCTRRACR